MNLGDWGSGNYNENHNGESAAIAIAKQIEQLKASVDYVIHLGHSGSG